MKMAKSHAVQMQEYVQKLRDDNCHGCGIGSPTQCQPKQCKVCKEIYETIDAIKVLNKVVYKNE